MQKTGQQGTGKSLARRKQPFAFGVCEHANFSQVNPTSAAHQNRTQRLLPPQKSGLSAGGSGAALPAVTWLEPFAGNEEAAKVGRNLPSGLRLRMRAPTPPPAGQPRSCRGRGAARGDFCAPPGHWRRPGGGRRPCGGRRCSGVAPCSRIRAGGSRGPPHAFRKRGGRADNPWSADGGDPG